MRKPKIGLIIVTCPTHLEALNETGEKWVDDKNLKRVENELKGIFELIKTKDIIASFHELEDVERKFLVEDVDVVFVYISTWNWPDQITQFIRNIGKPVILYAMADSKAWSIGGLAATHGGLDEIGIKHSVIYGDIKNKDIKKTISAFSNASRAKNILRRSRYGSIGGQGMGILTGRVDANQWLKKFGIITGYTDQYTLVIEAERIDKKKVKDYYNMLDKEYKKIPEFNKVFENSIKISLALEDLIEKERYDFTGLKCTFDLSDNYCSACLAQSRLANRGFISACLNDSNGALSSYILSLLKNNDEPVFTADVNLASSDSNIIKLIDDGAASPKLTIDPKREVELCYQPYLEAKASGVCTKLIAKPGTVTLIRLARIDGKYKLHLTEGEALEVDESDREDFIKECGYPMWPHALVKIKGDMEKFIENLRSEYIHMTYGNLKDDIKEFCKMFDIELIEN